MLAPPHHSISKVDPFIAIDSAFYVCYRYPALTMDPNVAN